MKIAHCLDNACPSRFQCWRYMKEVEDGELTFKESPRTDPLDKNCYFFMGISPLDGNLRQT